MACTHLDTPDILTQAQSLGMLYSYTEVQPQGGICYKQAVSQLSMAGQSGAARRAWWRQMFSNQQRTWWDWQNFLLLQQLFWLPHQPLILLKWVAVTFLFGRRLKIAEYPFKTDRRLNKEAKIHALGVLIIDRLFRSLWWNVPFISSLCTFYLQHTSARLEPWPSWQNRTCAWWTIPVTMWVTYKRIQKRNKYAWWTTKHKTWEITKQTRIQKLKQKHYICEINNPNNNMGSRAWECGYVVFAFDLFSFFVFL